MTYELFKEIILLEPILVDHEKLLVLSFTLMLVLAGLATVLANLLNAFVLNKQISSQEKIFLQNMLYQYRDMLIRIRLEASSIAEKRIIVDEEVESIEKQIINIETILSKSRR
jgi:hypothetical protein